MTAAPTTTPGSRELDLSLFRLPTAYDPRNAEMGIGRRNAASAAIKLRFWAQLARRLDLTGPGSFVSAHPYGTGHDRVLAGLEARLDALYEAIEARHSANVVTPASKTRPSQLPRQVASMIEEVTPQFFLRNIPRVERPTVNVRRLGYRYVVWRDDQDEMIEFARRPYIEPIDFLKELSTAAMRELAAEAWRRVYGLNWETDVGNFKPAVFRVPSFGAESSKRIPIEKHTDDAAPALREGSMARHASTLKQLGKRFDASKD